jgi:sterol desaturase/sphingolipid hydroxylase (fatty acid hydroxylase superfamily)
MHGTNNNTQGGSTMSIMPSTWALEALFRLSRTRVNYWLESVLDTLLGIALLTAGLRHHVALPGAAALVLLGLFVFSFMEYVFHRWVFHGPLQTMARGHASHHADPRGYDSLPFFLPALVLFCVVALCKLLAPAADVWLLASGIAFGYVAYGVAHFMIHHRRFRSARLRRWAARHHIHHHHPERNFGVTTPLWDVLLATGYVPRRSTSAASARSASDTSTR